MTDKCPFDKTPEEIFKPKTIYTPVPIVAEKAPDTLIDDAEVEQIEALYGVCEKCKRGAE